METLIKTLTDSKTGNKVLPRTKSRAITMADGTNLDNKLVELGQQLTILSGMLDERTIELCTVNVSTTSGDSVAGQIITLTNITDSSKLQTYTLQSGENSHAFKVISGQVYKISVNSKAPFITPTESSQFTAIAGNSRTVTMQYIAYATFNVAITGSNKSGITVTATKGSKVVSGVTDSNGNCSFTTNELGTYTVAYSKNMLSSTQSVNVSAYTTYSITGQTDDRTFLIKDGVINNALTGGFSHYQGSGSVTQGSGYLDVTLWNNLPESSVSICGTANKIDLTNFNTLYVEFNNVGTVPSGMRNSNFEVVSSKAYGTGIFTESLGAVGVTVGSKTTITLDVTNANGMYYINDSASSGSTLTRTDRIYNIYLK